MTSLPPGSGPPPQIAGVVLAGGRSSRFGRDKLVEPVDGRPLLDYAVRALAPVVEEIVLVVGPDAGAPALPDAPPLPVPLRVVRDPDAFGGPLMALSAALDAIELPLALLVGGDMPALQPALLAAMVTALIERSADVVILAGPGPFQSIPAAMRVAPARAAARESLAAGSRSLRALYDRLDVAVLPEAAWRVFDPEGATLRDVDTPADLPPERRSRPPAAS